MRKHAYEHKIISGSHEMLKILMEVFHDNSFFVSFTFGLIGLGLYYIGLMAILILSTSLSVCECLCFEGEVDLIT